MKVTLLTGGGEKHYQMGLLSGLLSNDVEVDVIGNDEMRGAELSPGSHYLNLRGDQNPHAPLVRKIWRIMIYYFYLLKYAAHTESRLFHIQWLNKFVYFDRTVLNGYYKLFGKKLIFTAHNLNAGERDEKDSFLNRLTLRVMYKMVDHIIVHTDKMKRELIERYNMPAKKITVIPHGVNNHVIKSDLTRKKAKENLGLNGDERVLLHFGQIAAYKGLEYLISALAGEKEKGNEFKLLIAGRVRRGDETYWAKIEKMIEENDLKKNIIEKMLFIPDKEIEVYFKAADVLILPYKKIFQSGVMFLSYSFGLPVIATDVGSLREDVVEGMTGYICQPESEGDLSRKIAEYFKSDLYLDLEGRRQKIMEWASEKYSWKKIGKTTREVYESLL